MTTSQTQDSARDIELMELVSKGDQQAFGELFDRHSSVLLGVLIRILRRREEAEEILQDVFHQAWKEAKRYEPKRATPRGWLIMLARSRALDRLRSNQSRGRREQVSHEERGPLEVAPVGTDHIEARERREQVLAALGSLSQDQRECVELAFFGGMSHSQIASHLNAPLGTVKSRILHGMRKLRATLEGSQLGSLGGPLSPNRPLGGPLGS